MTNDTPNTTGPAVALEHMTGPSRGSVTWLYSPTLDVALDDGCLLHIREATPGDPGPNHIARFHRVDDTYEVEASEDRAVWVNGNRIQSQRLKHGDTVEFGDTGPLCRCRFYSDHSPARNSVADILGDIAVYLRVSRQPPLKRAFRACGALFGRLSFETSLLFRITVLAAIAVFGVLAWQQQKLNTLLKQDIENAARQLDDVGVALVNAQKDALRPSDLTALRDSLEQRVISNVSRLEDLEMRSTASARIIAASSASVAFLQGTYGYRDPISDKALRHAVNDDGIPLVSPRGRPFLTLEGDGPLAELQFTGTGFVANAEGYVVTNRHVALPWEQNAGEGTIEGVVPVMTKFIAYLPGESTPVALVTVLASEEADLAIVRTDSPLAPGLGLPLVDTLPARGDEVIVMGYPTGLRSMLAQSGAAFIQELQETENTGFFTVAERLAQNGFISPLASRGIVAQATPSTIMYDAETTHGGSGGPVLDVGGNVVAVNAAFLPEFGGSNIGVPATLVRALLAEAMAR